MDSRQHPGGMPVFHHKLHHNSQMPHLLATQPSSGSLEQHQHQQRQQPLAHSATQGLYTDQHQHMASRRSIGSTGSTGSTILPSMRYTYPETSATPHSEISASPKKKRSNSGTHASPSSSRAIQASNSLLDGVKIIYPCHEFPSDMLRVIPESQVNFIRPLLYPSSSSSSSVVADPFITKKKYATNVDERTFLSVYEFQINDHWIIWDYHTGYIFFTGLWKAAGNTKTDIVKLVDNIPSIASQVRRVRGGFLKIQGTWLPFETCKTLAKNFAFPIRYCLVPLFGETFPDECLKPGNPHYGKLVDINDPPQTRIRRKWSQGSKDAAPPKVQKPLVKKRSQSDTVSRRGSGSSNVPILELEEVLKASKQLHDLSASSGIIGVDGTVKERQLSFNYGGFIWSWQDENNLTILGKDEEAILDDDDTSSVAGGSGPATGSSRHGSASWSRQLQNLNLTSPSGEVKEPFNSRSPRTSFSTSGTSATSPSTYTTQHDSIQETPRIPEPTRYSHDDTVPKTFEGDESIFSAAKQLMNFSGKRSSDSSLRDTPLERDTTSPKVKIGDLLA
ncbi:Transcriptional repressor XBP1 [Cyberlindnera fabianii]|uniref:Transcriptional repressor XBP1 n=1 Tax=Cyberlindnera fabianii TaxID=36022 RepID=A0A1V2LCB0_CYBFA|nr:Transcriptional repressor XBP1 [Cyberlindnera fabianii]